MSYLASNVDVRVVRGCEQSTGKKRYVWVDLNNATPYPVYVTKGIVLKNAKVGKIFQGDLIDYKPTGEGYVLRTYLVAKDVTAEATELLLVRDEFKHLPIAGDVLMKAPASLTGTGTAGAVTSVVATSTETEGNVWKCAITANALGTLKKGDILVEAVEAGATKKMLVQNPNTFAERDVVFNFEPATGDEDFMGARYMFTPILHGIAWVNRMSPLPACVKAINKSRVTEWFEL